MFSDEPWFAVKCVFAHPTRVKDEGSMLYEERITLCRADSWEEAFAKGRREAELYAHEEDCELVQVTDAFHLFDRTLDEGVEVWSTMRESNLRPDLYVKTFCVTERDRVDKKKEAEPGATDNPDDAQRI